jgi:ATP-dependent helicase/nuclease subunit B
LPGPFVRVINSQSRDAAQQLLEEISHAVFADDLEDNFLHRGWLQRWLEKIPHYLDWQISREEAGRVDTVEADLRTEGFAPELELQGRLDRIDQQHDELAVVDYKTGTIPAEAEVLSGEAVQLPFYALLAQQRQLPVNQVEYLALEGRKLGSQVVLQGEELERLRDASAERLITLQREMVQSRGLPAWGDETVCRYCHMEGLCRRSAWPLEGKMKESADDKKGG